MESLADRIARGGPLQELDAVGWAIRLAKRLEALHALGVAHGSISPACVLTAGTERSARAFLADVRRTESAPAFQSPERVLGGESSTADDTWAVAATLYTALTGKAPFSGANDTELRQKILAASPAPLSAFDIGDDDLQHILDRALSRDIKQRTTTVSALRHALEEWHPDPNVAQLPPLDDEDAAEEQTMSRAVPVYAPKMPRALEDEVPSAGLDVTAPYNPGDFAAPAPPSAPKPLAGFAVAALEDEDLSDEMATVALRVQKAAPAPPPGPPPTFDAAAAQQAAQDAWKEETASDAEKTRALPTANLGVSPAAEEPTKGPAAPAPVAPAAPSAPAPAPPTPAQPAQAREPKESARDLSPATVQAENNRRGVLLIALIALVLTAALTYAILRLRGAAGVG